MRVFVAGGTGALGRPLVRALVAAGHSVVASTRSEHKTAAIRQAGASAVVVDAFDREGLRAAITAAAPEVVVHQLTSLSAPFNSRRYGSWLAETNRLRRDVTPVLVEAARAAGARQVVVQSVAFLTAPEGPPVLDESGRLYTEAPEPFGEAVAACVALERAVLATPGIDGVVLRYGFFYGPGTGYAPDGDIATQVRRRRYPVVGSGAGRFSFVHVEDAAAATLAALEGGSGVYNICDDEPARCDEWLPEMARLLNAPRPIRMPSVIARLLAGRVAVYYSTALRGACNAKARRELSWQPHHPSWREGFRATLR
jgi:nucleoside-diphosphate-sugar epimerase